MGQNMSETVSLCFILLKHIDSAYLKDRIREARSITYTNAVPLQDQEHNIILVPIGINPVYSHKLQH